MGDTRYQSINQSIDLYCITKKIVTQWVQWVHTTWYLTVFHIRSKADQSQSTTWHQDEKWANKAATKPMSKRNRTKKTKGQSQSGGYQQSSSNRTDASCSLRSICYNVPHFITQSHPACVKIYARNITWKVYQIARIDQTAHYSSSEHGTL